MKFSNNMMWSKPYVESVRHLVPVHKVTKFRGYVVPISLQPTTEASMIKYPDGRITVNVMLSGYRVRAGNRLPTTFEVALLALAHELAHLIYWDHEPEHMILMSKIMCTFGKVASEEGVRDTSRRLKRIFVGG